MKLRKLTDNYVDMTPEIEKMILDGQRLLTYIARHGNVNIDPEENIFFKIKLVPLGEISSPSFN